MNIRPIETCDLKQVEAIQSVSPQAAQWPVADYLQTVCLVAEEDDAVIGFAAARQLLPEEAEILNVAVAPPHRRRGVACAMLRNLMDRLTGELFLEVRASNLGAICLYESLGFSQVGIRESYYSQPGEDGIVLRFQPC